MDLETRKNTLIALEIKSEPAAKEVQSNDGSLSKINMNKVKVIIVFFFSILVNGKIMSQDITTWFIDNDKKYPVHVVDMPPCEVMSQNLSHAQISQFVDTMSLCANHIPYYEKIRNYFESIFDVSGVKYDAIELTHFQFFLEDSTSVVYLVNFTFYGQGEAPIDAVYLDPKLKIWSRTNTGMYDVFRPNNDAKNDWFQVLHLPTNYQLTIFNRWGQSVFESTDADKKWSGQNEQAGQDCTSGVYYYELLDLDVVASYTGFVQLVR